MYTYIKHHHEANYWYQKFYPKRSEEKQSFGPQLILSGFCMQKPLTNFEQVSSTVGQSRYLTSFSSDIKFISLTLTYMQVGE